MTIRPRSLLTCLLVFLTTGTLLAQIDSGFRWVNPYPTGEVIWDVERVDQGVFVAVTDNGFILRSADRGFTWSYFQNRILENLWSVGAADGVVVVGAEGGVAYASSDQGLSWREIQIPDFSQNLHDIAVINRLHWVAVGSTLLANGVVVVTRDGGETWKQVDPGVPVSFRSVCFIDSLHGWASGSPGTVISTSDGGDSWEVNQSPLLYGLSLNVVRFGTAMNGLVAGDGGRLFVTDDGGESWTPQPQRQNTVFHDAAWLDDSIVVLVGERQQLRSTDGGQTWEEALAGSRPAGVGFGQSRIEGMVAGSDGEMLYTSDGGVTWVRRSRGAAGRNIYDLAFHESGLAFAVGSGSTVIRSDDFGASWGWTKKVPPYVPGHLTRVVVPSEKSVVAVAEDGAVYHSKTKGDTWSNKIINTNRRLRDISFSDSLNGWIVGHGVIFSSTDGGASWRGDSTSVPHVLWGVHAVSPSLVYMTGESGRLFLTEDGGEKWEEVDNEFTVRFTMVKADLEGNITMGWLGGLVHSTDKGETWSDHPAPDKSGLRHFSFLTPEIGWCGRHGQPFLMTTDAGKTWETREHGLRTSPQGNAGMEVVEMIEPGYGFVAGSSGFILEYRDPEVSGVAEGREHRGQDRRQAIEMRWIDADILHVSLGTPTYGDLVVTDLLGRIVATHRAEGGDAYLNCSGLPSGVYFVYSSVRGSVGHFVKQ